MGNNNIRLLGTGLLMKNNIDSPSTRIAKEMIKVLGSQVKTVSVDIKHRQAIGNFVRKIEKAHQQAAKSTQRFG
jgi:lipoate-protein ligase A